MRSRKKVRKRSAKVLRFILHVTSYFFKQYAIALNVLKRFCNVQMQRGVLAL